MENVVPSGASSKVVRCCPRMTVMWMAVLSIFPNSNSERCQPGGLRGCRSSLGLARSASPARRARSTSPPGHQRRTDSDTRTRACRRQAGLSPLAPRGPGDESSLEPGEPAGARSRGRALDGSIVSHEVTAEPRQRGPAAPRAAELRLDGDLPEALVDPGDERPGPTIRHLHGPPGRGDGAGLPDQLEQPDLPGPDRGSRSQIDSHGQSRHARYGIIARYAEDSILTRFPTTAYAAWARDVFTCGQT